ncbi:MAG: histidinol-phosphate transaminase [Acidimicrobiales bacterium]
MIGRPRPNIAALPAYRPGKGAAQAEAEHGIVNAIKLASNETPWGPVPSVVAAVQAAATTTNRYADHRASELRAALAGWVGLDVERVTVGCGSVGLLQQLLLTYVDPGDEVLYPWRSFEVYPVYTALVGGVAVTTPLRDATFDLEAVVAAVTERTKLIILANPNNPTGTALPMSDIAALLDRVDPSIIVVLDEAYREFMSDELGNPVPDLIDRYDNLCVLRTFSKAQGLAALRVGYAMGHPEVIESIDKTLFPFAVNGLAQVAAMASIEAHDEVMERVSRIIAERDRVVAALQDAGWQIPKPEANFVYLDLGSRTDEVYLDLERSGVVTRPFSGEGIRVTISTPEENDRFLAALLGR